MENNRQVLSVRILQDYSMRLKTWAIIGNMHNTISLEYDENDIVSYAICRYNVMGSSLYMDFVSPSNSTSISGYSPSRQFNILEKEESHTVPRTFRLSPDAESQFNSIIIALGNPRKITVFKDIVKNIVLNNDEFIRFIIKNYLISVFADISLSYLNGKVTSRDFKAFVLNNREMNSTTKMDKNMIFKLIKRIEEISSYGKLIEEIKNSDTVDRHRTEEWVRENLSKIDTHDYVPYSELQIRHCLFNFYNIGSSFPTILELFAMYSSLVEWEDVFPNAYKIYPWLFKKIIIDRIIAIEESNKKMIDENYKKFKEILFDEAENLKNLVQQ